MIRYSDLYGTRALFCTHCASVIYVCFESLHSIGRWIAVHLHKELS